MFLRTACLFLLIAPAMLSSIHPEKKPEQQVPKQPRTVVKTFDTILYKDKEDRRMVEVFYDKLESGKDYMADCYILADKLVTKEFLANFPPDRVVVLPTSQLEIVLNECSALLLAQLKDGSFHSATVGTRGSIGRGAFDSLAIFPGTKWCGAGNVASDYEDLGVKEETDKCCRDHDHCYDSIPARETKYGLKNKAIYTKSHCDCDKKFYSCLKDNNVSESNTVGGLYYNVLQVQCFENTYPIVKCLDYSGWLPGIFWSCQKYEFDTSKPKAWQFLDARRY